jgi:predicted ferric reductase
MSPETTPTLVPGASINTRGADSSATTPDARDGETRSQGTDRTGAAVAVRLGAWALSAGVAGAVLGWIIVQVSNSDAGLWLLARSSGIVAYLLLTTVTIIGLHLATGRSPRVSALAARMRGPGTHRLSTHSVLALFAIIFTIVHVVVLAIDPWAKVGWMGALLPFGADYRPLPVTLGLLALWSALLSGVTAAAAGRIGGRAWSAVHVVAGLAWILAWGHGVFAGSDTGALLWMYVITGAVVIGFAVRRYARRTPDDARRSRARALQVPR